MTTAIGVQGALNRLAGTSGLAEQAAANAAIDRVGNLDVNAGHLTTGESNIPRLSVISQAFTCNTQRLVLGYFTCRKTEPITQVRILVGSTAAAATPTIIRYGLYTVAANGDIDLVASTANDTTLMATQLTAVTKALSATYTKVMGQRYACGILVVSAAATPTVCGQIVAGGIASEAGLAPKIAGHVSGQANLPSNVVAASITDANGYPYMALLP